MTIFLVQTRPVPGQEAEYNDWYTNVHLKDLLTIPEVVSAQRFKLSSTQRSAETPDYPYEYIAIYELKGDPTEFFRSLESARERGMAMSTAIDDDRISHVFEPVTDRLTA